MIRRPEHNQNPNSLAGFLVLRCSSASHANEPEHSISYINEYVENGAAWYANENKQYENALSWSDLQSSRRSTSGFSPTSVPVEQLYDGSQNYQ